MTRSATEKVRVAAPGTFNPDSSIIAVNMHVHSRSGWARAGRAGAFAECAMGEPPKVNVTRTSTFEKQV